jgi:hypothetical protein
MTMGDIGALFALKGDRYLPRGGVRHRTTPNFLEPATLTAACGIAESATYWRGTGSQEEYERLASIPRCTRCIHAEKGPDGVTANLATARRKGER